MTILRNATGALASVVLLASAPVPLACAAQGLAAPAALVPARTSCDPDGRCYETGDPGFDGDDDLPPPPRRHRHRYDRDDPDGPPPPPPPRDRFDDDRPPPPPHRGFDRDDD